MKITSRKHWFSYTGNLLLILIIVIPSVIFYYKGEIHLYFRITILIFGILILYRAVRRIILNTRIEWIFEDDILTTKSGLLPWRRSDFDTDISQIYEAFFTKSFMGTILGYGGLHIRRTDGVTSQLFQYKMNNHKEMVSEINSAVSSYKNRDVGKNEVLTNKDSLTEELRKLADLNKDGVISNEEFEKLKRKIIE